MLCGEASLLYLFIVSEMEQLCVTVQLQSAGGKRVKHQDDKVMLGEHFDSDASLQWCKQHPFTIILLVISCFRNSTEFAAGVYFSMRQGTRTGSSCANNPSSCWLY